MTEDQIFWGLGQGNINFWYDHWMGEAPLYKCITNAAHTNDSVKSFSTGDGWSCSPDVEVVQDLSINMDCCDRPVWKLS